MKTLDRWTICVATLLPAPAVWAAEVPAGFTLGNFIPADCWLYIHGAHNPESEFIYRNWARVFDTACRSGVGEELKKLITSDVPEAERAEVEQTWQQLSDLSAKVHWSDLCSAELAMGIRFPAGAPGCELMVLTRGTPASADANIQGLNEILEALAGLSPEHMKVVEEDVFGTQVRRLQLVGAPMALDVFRKRDVIGFTLGIGETKRPITREVLALMSEPADTDEPRPKPIVRDARYVDALKELGKPEDSITYLDLRRMFAGMRDLMKSVTPPSPPKDAAPDDPAVAAAAEAAAFTKFMTALFDELDLFESVAMVETTEGMQSRYDSVCQLQPGAAQKPLYTVFAADRKLNEFDRFLPADATGFAVSSCIDPEAAYDAVIDFFKRNLPDGAAKVDRWNAGLATHGFDPHRDVFAWLSGEYISVTLPPAFKTAFGAGEWVLLARVKDAELALAKVNTGAEKLAEFLKTNMNQLVTISDAPEVNAERFRVISHPMMAMVGLRGVYYGVKREWLIVGTSPTSINKCLDTGAGKLPTIASNPRFQKEGVIPSGPVVSASFTDLTNMAEELGGAFLGLGMLGALIPDQPDAKGAKALINTLGRLAPAVAEIDFFSSQASATTFDGKAWRSTTVYTYRPSPKKTD